ncbi:MAG: sigma-70 family RNA polymerase sigma factor [Puia sp.]|nr:sigma-70 family RNA polymerase sigma factor [Puia sp.]
MQEIRQEQVRLKNEEAVMTSFREGNKDAFRVIFEQLVKPLTYFVENIIYSKVDAEDIVSSGFYKLYQARMAMRSYEHVKRWLYVIVRNEAIDYLRAKTQRRESHVDIAYLESGSIEQQAETERVRAILLQELHAEIEKLPRQRRAVLLLYFFKHKNTAEIAHELGLNPQTVLNHKTKAIIALRESGRFKWLIEGSICIILAAVIYLLLPLSMKF